MINISATGYRLKHNEKLAILPLSDLHLGSEQFNAEYFEYCLEKIDNIKSKKRIYLIGDLMESASKKVGNSSFHVTMTLDEQLDAVIDYLKPFKDDIYFTCIGNHEARLSKDYDFNIMRYVAKCLDCDYGYQNIDTFNINGNPFRIYTAHGKGSSAYHYTAESKIIRDNQTVEADLIINGHNHRCGHFSIPIRTGKGMKRKHYCFSGAFLSYNGYPDSMMLPILPEAFIQLSLDKDRIMRKNEFFIDERRPDLMNL